MAQQAVEKKSSKETIFTGAFSTFSVNDVKAAEKFYGETLGLVISKTEEGGLNVEIPGSEKLFIYPKDDHKPATFTVLNFVDDIKSAVDELKNRGIKFESYEGDIETDKNNIFWGKEQNMGPNIAWFADPAGNILSMIEE